MVKNFNNMQLAPAMADCMNLYRRTTTYFTENERFYGSLLESLRLLVPNREEILRVAISIGNWITLQDILMLTAQHRPFCTR